MSFLLIAFTSMFSFLLGYLRHCYSYWELQGVQQLRPHFIYGHFFKLKSVHLSELLQETYDAFKGKAQLAGTYVFTRPIAVVTDLNLVKCILGEDLDKFKRKDKSFLDEKWQKFTLDNKKYIFTSITEVAQQLEQTCQDMIGSQEISLQMDDLLSYFTIDAVANCAFGIPSNTLNNPKAELRKLRNDLLSKAHSCIRYQIFKATFASELEKFPINWRLFKQKETDILREIIEKSAALRERENIKRKDFIDMLIKQKIHTDDVTLKQLTNQMYEFIVNDSETSVSTLSCAMFELAKNDKVQSKLREEIAKVMEKYKEILRYEAVMEMTYLDQVISETLRKYPSRASMTLLANEDYTLPSNNTDESPIIIEKNTLVHIPVRAIHHDPQIYPKPEEFRPERFDPAAGSRHHSISFLSPHGLDKNFALLQMKIVFITLLSKFEFTLLENSAPTLEMSKKFTILIPAKGVKLQVKRI